MADLSTQSITINADPDAVMAVIADFEAYPEWTGRHQDRGDHQARAPTDGPGRSSS